MLSQGEGGGLEDKFEIFGDSDVGFEDSWSFSLDTEEVESVWVLNMGLLGGVEEVIWVVETKNDVEENVDCVDVVGGEDVDCVDVGREDVDCVDVVGGEDIVDCVAVVGDDVVEDDEDIGGDDDVGGEDVGGDDIVGDDKDIGGDDVGGDDVVEDDKDIGGEDDTVEVINVGAREDVFGVDVGDGFGGWDTDIEVEGGDWCEEEIKMEGEEWEVDGWCSANRLVEETGEVGIFDSGIGGGDWNGMSFGLLVFLFQGDRLGDKFVFVNTTFTLFSLLFSFSIFSPNNNLPNCFLFLKMSSFSS